MRPSVPAVLMLLAGTPCSAQLAPADPQERSCAAGSIATISRAPTSRERTRSNWWRSRSRDPAAMLEVFVEVDGGHAAGTQFALDPVAVGEAGGECSAWGRVVGHGVTECTACAHLVAGASFWSFSLRSEALVHHSAVEQRQNVWMIELGGEGDLAEEPFGAEAVGQFRVEDLDGDRAVVPAVVREIDGGHAARTELPLDAVTVGQGRGEADYRISQAGPLFPRVDQPKGA